METTHKIFFKDSKEMMEIKSNSVDLIVTSPPYPMIEMWDDLFSSQDGQIKSLLMEKKANPAFRLMHEQLNQTWNECIRVLKESGVICVNIGDATRKVGSAFQLFPNHVKVVDFFQNHGCIVLPCILWRKQTNSPTKFMGSGMIPSNAYVSLEHEYILLFRKGKKKRKFQPKSEQRYNSAYFWEERNKWFSDIWKDVKGISQQINSHDGTLRERSAAFPFEIPYRLINMFSIYGDTILDPFWGTGTTSIAAMITARNSIGYEFNKQFSQIFEGNIEKLKKLSETINKRRISEHKRFVKNYRKKKEIKYKSKEYNFPVITSQEKNILFYSLTDYKKDKNFYAISYDRYENW